MSRRPIASVAVTLAAAALALSACTGGSNAVDQSNGGQFRYHGATKVGTLIPIDKRKPAGPVSVELLDSKSRFSLTADRGKVMVLNFWSTQCAVCVIETPQFDALYRRLKSPTLQFVGLAVTDVNKSAVRSFVHNYGITYPIVYDQEGRSAMQLGKLPLVGLPDTVVIDKQGRVAGIYIGSLTPGDLAPVLSRLATET